MKKNSIVMFLLSVCLLGFYGCSDEDDPEDGKGAIYQVTLPQSLHEPALPHWPSPPTP